METGFGYSCKFYLKGNEITVIEYVRNTSSRQWLALLLRSSGGPGLNLDYKRNTSTALVTP